MDITRIDQKNLTKGERTRVRMLDEAIACFIQKGFDGASFTELAEFAKVNRGMFVHYFGSKQALIESCLDCVRVGLKNFTDDFMSNQEDKWPDQIECYVEATFVWLKTYPHHANFLLLCVQRSSYDDGVADKVRDTFKKAWQRINKILPAKSSAEPKEVSDLTREIHTTIVGSILMTVTMGGQSYESFRRQCHDAVQKLRDSSGLE